MWYSKQIILTFNDKGLFFKNYKGGYKLLVRINKGVSDI